MWFSAGSPERYSADGVPPPSVLRREWSLNEVVLVPDANMPALSINDRRAGGCHGQLTVLHEATAAAEEEGEKGHQLTPGAIDELATDDSGPF